MANIAVARIKREFKEVVKSEEVGRVEFTGRDRNTLRLLFHIYTV